MLEQLKCKLMNKFLKVVLTFCIYGIEITLDKFIIDFVNYLTNKYYDSICKNILNTISKDVMFDFGNVNYSIMKLIFERLIMKIYFLDKVKWIELTYSIPMDRNTVQYFNKIINVIKMLNFKLCKFKIINEYILT